MKCLEKEPGRRYSSAVAFTEDLKRWENGEPIEARPVTAMERTVKWMKRKPVYAGCWGVAALLLLLLGIGGPIVAYNQKQLKDAATESKIVATEAQGNSMPPVVFGRETFASLAKLGGDQGARRLLEDARFDVCTVPFDDAAIDIDTPKDLSQLSRNARS